MVKRYHLWSGVRHGDSGRSRWHGRGLCHYVRRINHRRVAEDDPDDPFDNCIGFCSYAGTPGNTGGFTTQESTFTARSDSGSGDEGEGIVVEAGLLPGVPDNGTDRLLEGGIVEMARPITASFRDQL